MSDTDRVQAVLAELAKVEQELLQRHHIRLRVDKVTPDGRNALCSAAQVRRRFLRSDHTSFEGIDACHRALISFQRIGLTPFIAWLPRERSGKFNKIDMEDPFRLKGALNDAREACDNTREAHVLLPAEPVTAKAYEMEHHG